MYANMHVIYGKPFTPECDELLSKLEDGLNNVATGNIPEEGAIHGFEVLWNEFLNARTGYCGVELWRTSCMAVAAAHLRPMVPTLMQQFEASDKLVALRPEFKELLRDHKIGVYFIFSTS